MASGKTTVANHLVKNFGFTKFALAEAIKEIELMLDHEKDEIILNYIGTLYPPIANSDKLRTKFLNILKVARTIPREEPKPRKRLQFLGTEGGRKKIDNNIWIDIVKKQTESHPYNVVDDCRFLNEFKAFKEDGWEIIYLDVSPEEQDKRLRNLYGNYDPDILNHPSETEVEKIRRNQCYVVNANELKTIERILNL